MEEGQRDLARVVMRVDAIGHGLVAARRRLMAVDAHIQRDDRAFGGARNARPVAAVDDRVRQRENQVADARFAVGQVGRHDLFDQRREFWPDAGQGGDRRKERIEERRAHV